MLILGIETSCDETAAAVVENGIKVLSSVVASSADIHTKTGGIIPEQAARRQVESMIPVVSKTLSNAFGSPSTSPHLLSTKVDAIAVTAGGPGLIGSMLVGVETAKTLSYLWDKPIVPVVHLYAHLYANWLTEDAPKFPAVILTVAGGHSDIFLMKDHGKFEWLGGTRDDAAGEAFDKTARLLNLPYPGGPSIQKAAKSGNADNVKLPRPLINSDDLDMSFSGLKTAVLRETQKEAKVKDNDLAASVQEAIAEVLTVKTIKAASQRGAKSIVVAGGVAANERLREMINEMSPIPVHIPPVNLCTDNATFIASYAHFNYHPFPWQDIRAIPDPDEAIKIYANHKS